MANEIAKKKAAAVTAKLQFQASMKAAQAVAKGEEPPAPPAHFSTHRTSCFFARSCAAALIGSLIHRALPSLAIPNACFIPALASASKEPSLLSLTATCFDFPPLFRLGSHLNP